MPNQRTLALIAAPSLALLAACGGGSGGNIASAPAPAATASPSPTPSPAPTPASTSAPVTIFGSPAPQEYAAIGVSTTSAGDGYTPVDQTAKLTDVAFDPSLQPRIRYNVEGYYEVQLPGAAFDRLIHYTGLADPTVENNFFQTASAPQNHATFITRRASELDFRYSDLASWSDVSGRTGYIAFGIPTPASAVPISGTATYFGVTTGQVDITYFDNLYGGNYFIGIDGNTRLNVDFSRGVLIGSLDLYVPDGMDPRLIGTYSTLPIPLASGTNVFSGRFDTSLAGFNQFNGLFTGPSAQEAIGSWALPLMIDGQPHQAIGGWIARRSN